MTDDASTGDRTEEVELTRDGITARYVTAETERILQFTIDDRTAVVVQNTDGYAMLRVCRRVDGDELERYYGFEMALDHAAELLEVSPHRLPIPEPAADMGM